MAEIRNIPKDWKWVKVGEYVISVKGKKPKRVSNSKTKECPIPYVNIKAFEKKIIDEYTDGVGCALCDDGDFLMVWDGSRSGYVGKAINGALGSTLVKLNFPDMYNNYAYYFLQSKYLDINSRAKGVGIPHVDPNILWNYDLLIPPISTQQAIVSKIEELFKELDKGIENLRTAQQQLKIYRQSVLSAGTSGMLTGAHKGYLDSITIGKPTKLNKKWNAVKLIDVAKLESGHTPRKDTPAYWENGDVLWLSLQDIRALDGKIATDTKYKTNEFGIKNSSARLLPEGTVCFCRDISVGYVTIMGKVMSTTQHFANWICTDQLNNKFLMYSFMASRDSLIRQGQGTTVKTIYMPDLKEMRIQLPSIKEQENIVQEIESRLSVADKMEESITQSLQQAEALRQSILKKAFEGKLLTELKPAVYKPKSEYFFDCQVLGYIIRASKKRNIRHGEMTLAKYAYLAVKIFGIPLSYIFQQWHLGPYPSEIKKAVNNKQFFLHTKVGLDLTDEKKLLKYDNPYQEKIEEAVSELVSIFEKYDDKSRPHKTELLATVCKVIEDTESADFVTVRDAMENWKINLKNSLYKNKAEKFTEAETQQCLSFIISKGWDTKLLNE